MKSTRCPGRDDDARLKAVNTFSIAMCSTAMTRETWGQVDYWTSPLELLFKGQGRL